MESYPFANFVLPVQPSALDTLIVATAFAYSRVWNRRRLENLSYGFWNHLLICLISTLAPNLFLIPQLTIYNAPEPREFPDLSINTVAERMRTSANPILPSWAPSFDEGMIRKKVPADSLSQTTFSNGMKSRSQQQNHSFWLK